MSNRKNGILNANDYSDHFKTDASMFIKLMFNIIIQKGIEDFCENIVRKIKQTNKQTNEPTNNKQKQ